MNNDVAASTRLRGRKAARYFEVRAGIEKAELDRGM